MKFLNSFNLSLIGFLFFAMSLLNVRVQAEQTNLDSLLIVSKNYDYNNTIDSSYARIEYEISLAYSKAEKSQLAIDHAITALKASIPVTKLNFRIHNSLGSYYLDISNYTSSIQEFEKALKISIKLNDPILIGMVHYNLSIHYEFTNNLDLAYSHLIKGYDLLISTKDTIKIIRLLNSKSHMEQRKGNIKKAEEDLTTALEVSLLSKNDYFISTTYNNSARFYLKVQDTIKAVDFLKKSYAIDIKSGKDADKAIVTYNIATIYTLINKVDSALIYYNLAKQYAENANQLNYLEYINKSLFTLYYEEGVYDSLPQVFEDYQSITDSILSQKNLDKYAEAQNEIELVTNKKEMELIQLNQKSSRQQLIMISLVAILLIIVLIGSTMARKNLLKQKKIVEALYQKTKTQKTKIEKQKDLLVISNNSLKSNAQSKDRIMSLLAHDLRTPFSSIRSLNHLIKVNGALTEKQLQFVDTSDKVITGGLDLISDILDIYKLEHFDQFELDQINISQLIKHSIDKMTPITMVKEQTIISDFEEDIEFEMNREMLQSAVDNLLSNASKYSESGKTIRVLAKKEKDLTIKICDDGQGFSEEEKSNIFERFNKFTRSTISAEHSTGLGLFLVKGFVEKLNGTITVNSENGKGSTFTMIFKSISK